MPFYPTQKKKKNEQGVKKLLNEHAKKLDIPHAKLSRNPTCL